MDCEIATEVTAGNRRSIYIITCLAWFDPTKQQKDFLFDNVQIAADMSRLTGDPFDAKHLSIQKLKMNSA